ncbi:MAG: VanW family protein [Bacteroidota bacterium]
MRPQDYIPVSWRRNLQLVRRHWRDKQSGVNSQMASLQAAVPALPSQLTLRLEIKRTSTYAEKVHNFDTANDQIERVLVMPDEVFSFWEAVGAPTKKRGYQEGRTLIGGVLKPTVGGGLCQLAGMLYYLGLQAGLEVMERHPHSVDIYTEETRYTPLGSDATVVYGYKDLRLRNVLAFPIAFQFEVGEGEITLHLKAEEAPDAHIVEFNLIPTSGNKVGVETWVGGESRGMVLYERFPG